MNPRPNVSLSTEGSHANELAELAAEFTQMCMNKWVVDHSLSAEAIARSFVAHGAIMVTAIAGGERCAADLREMADQIELGNMSVAGCG